LHFDISMHTPRMQKKVSDFSNFSGFLFKDERFLNKIYTFYARPLDSGPT